MVAPEPRDSEASLNATRNIKHRVEERTKWFRHLMARAEEMSPSEDEDLPKRLTLRLFTAAAYFDIKEVARVPTSFSLDALC